MSQSKIILVTNKLRKEMSGKRYFHCLDHAKTYLKIYISTTPARAANKAASHSKTDTVYMFEEASGKTYAYAISSRSVPPSEIAADQFLQAETTRRAQRELRNITRRLHACQIKQLDDATKSLIREKVLNNIHGSSVTPADVQLTSERKETFYKQAARRSGYFTTGGPFRLLPRQGTPEHGELVQLASEIAQADSDLSGPETVAQTPTPLADRSVHSLPAPARINYDGDVSEGQPSPAAPL
jgi:hypothetical protein